jgi:uncharacterized protein YdeI (YjbR/CyaY-like superfamily)
MGSAGRGEGNEKAPLEVPADFAAALEVLPDAKAAFMRLPPSHRREHIMAIEQAERPDTRRRRIESAIDMLLRGGGRGT